MRAEKVGFGVGVGEVGVGVEEGKASDAERIFTPLPSSCLHHSETLKLAVAEITLLSSAVFICRYLPA